MGAGLINQVSQDTDFYDWFNIILKIVELIYALTR